MATVTTQNPYYTPRFFQSISCGSRRSAEKVLAIAFDYLVPGSVVDVGCGTGDWLDVARAMGCTTLTGLDGHWVSPNSIRCRTIDFHQVDFESAFTIPGRHDLCLSLEVAEHISKRQAEYFVDQLCRAADVVLFSAAIPGQGGAHHVNEQPQSYWIEQFKVRAYECFDVVRPGVWNDESVELWYRQNAFLFVKDGAENVNRQCLERDRNLRIYDLVHPGLYRWKLNHFIEPDLRGVLRHLRNYARVTGKNLLRASRLAAS